MVSRIKPEKNKKTQDMCEFEAKKFEYSMDLPINGPKQVTKRPLPTMCHPKAAGSCSSEQYSETHNVKLLKAIPVLEKVQKKIVLKKKNIFK